MKKKDNNINPGDNDISTKKGFLITLPGLKRKTESSLMPPEAKKPSSPAASAENRKSQTPEQHQAGSKKAPKNQQNRQNQAKAPGTETNVNSAGKAPASSSAQPQKNPGQNPSGANRNNRPGQNQQERQNNKAQNNKAQNNQNSNQKNQNGANTQNGNQKNQSANGQNNQNQNNPNNRGGQGNFQNRSGKNRQQSGQKQQNQNQSKQQESPAKQNQQTAKPQGGSNSDAAFPAISSLKQDFRVKKSGSKDKQDKTSGNMPSVKLTGTSYADAAESQKAELERKYANAVPLAIAIEEETRAKNALLLPPVPVTDPLAETDAPETPEGKEPAAGQTVEIVGIRFREAGKIYYFDPNGMKVHFGTPVIVETARGSEYGFCAIPNRFVPVSSIVPPLKKIERIATNDDTRRHNDNKALEEEAAKIFIEKAAVHKLDMHLIYVEYTFDNSKLLFYFTAEGRVDFRELVKDLASIFRTRIELRQIGVRDEAKILGGLGVCGRTLCCNTFLGEFLQVSIKMAKDQSLSLNSSKISGTCGRLMCCLRYEDEVYEEEGARTPKLDAIVDTPEGKGVVVERNALQGIVKVQLNDKPDTHPKNFTREEVTVVGYIKRKDEVEEELKELEKE